MLRHPIRMAEPTAPASGSVVRIHEGSIETIQYTDGELVTAVGRDIYDDESLINRSTLRFPARIGPGFSGAPVLDGDGSLTGIVTLRSRCSGQIYAITTYEIRQAFAATDLETTLQPDRCVP